MKTKGQKGFAIVNIIMGVVMTTASFVMFGDPSVGPGGIICLILGVALWCVGAWALRTLKLNDYDEVRVKQACLWNLVCFVFSCITLLACTVLPFVAPYM